MSNDFIELRDRVEVYGHGFSTQIIGFNKNPKNVRDIDGDDMECQGVFHMGSYNTYMGDMGAKYTNAIWCARYVHSWCQS